MLPKIAIICANYNYGRFIIEGMESIKKRSFPAARCAIIFFFSQYFLSDEPISISFPELLSFPLCHDSRPSFLGSDPLLKQIYPLLKQ